MTRAGAGPGLLLVDKPSGVSSHAIVSWARRTLGVRRIGHAGTLDPLATGLLPCLVGRATRLVPYLQEWSKTYVGVIQLGEETPTGDAESARGEPPAPLPPADVLSAARRRLTGTYGQFPPAFSAKKVRGTPAYRLARQGFPPDLAPSTVTVYAFRVRALTDGRLAFAARVSSGTYIRSLARDLGRIVGTGAHLATLRRTRIGPLPVREALVPDRSLSREDLLGALVPLEDIPLPMPSVTLPDDEAGRFCSGNRVPCPDPSAGGGPTRVVRVSSAGSRLLGLAERGEDGTLAPRVVFMDPGSLPETLAGSPSCD